MHMNVTADYQQELSNLFEGVLIRTVENEFKASFNEINNKHIKKFAELDPKYHITIKRSGTGMTTIFKPRKKSSQTD